MPAPSLPEWPAPAVGDVVAFAGDWPGESLVGQVRSLQRLNGRWVADVVPMEDQVGSIWRLPSAPRARSRRLTVEVSELVPLAASYVRESDAWAIERSGDESTGLNGTAVGLARRADGYRVLEEDFVPRGGLPRLNYEGERVSLEAYNALKRRLLLDTVIAGGLGGLLAFYVGGVADAAAFALGACSSLAYVLLLGRAADKAGSGDGSDLSDARLGPPLAAFLLLAAYHALFDAENVRPLSVVPRDEFVAAATGVLIYRVPLLAREIAGTGLKPDDVFEIAPGSVGIAARERRRQGGETASNAVPARDVGRTVLVLCGPPATGKSTLARALVKNDDRFAMAAWTTVVQDRREDNFDRPDPPSILLDETDQRDNLKPADYAVDLGDFALRKDQLLDRSDSKVAILDCDVQAARQLEYLQGARLVGVWVSLASLEAFEERLQQTLIERAIAEGQTPRDEIAAEVASKVNAKLATIVDDIDFGVTSDLFEFTIINDAEIEQAIAKLRKAATYIFL